MSEKDIERVLTEIHRLLDESDMDYVLICSRDNQDGGFSSNLGFKTNDGFRKLAHGLVAHSVSVDGRPSRAFISAVREMILKFTFQNAYGKHLN